MKISMALASNEAAWRRFQIRQYGLLFRWCFGLALLATLLLPATALGQSSPITASVNRSEFSTDELVILTVTLVDNSALQPRPILPPLDGLAVVDLDLATDVNTVAGKIQTTVTYTYRLQPRRTGLLIIPPIKVKIGDKVFQSAPISIRVTQGAPPAPSSGNAVKPIQIKPPADLAGKDFFVESLVDQPQPYVGQQIIYTFRFYQAIQLYRQPQYEGPLFTGFETLGMPVQEYNLDFDGRTYLITEIRTALFPKAPGRVSISPARLMFPGNIYEEPLELYAEPVTVEARPLPANAPSEFKGAVGQYEIQAWFSPQVALLNQPTSLYIAINGIGNIQTLPEPTWPEMAGWRTYDSLNSLNTDMKDGMMSGTRVYERLIVPDQVGDFTVPPASLVYFDPVAEEYRTTSTQPLTVKVILAPTPDPAAVTATAQAVPTATPASVAAVAGTPAPPIQLVNPGLIDLQNTRWQLPLPVFAVLIMVLCGATPLAAVAGASGFWLWQRQKTRQEKKQAEEAQVLRQPSQRIHPALAAAMQTSGDNYRTASQALYTYLSQLLNEPVKGLTRAELTRRLRQRGLSEALIGRIGACLNQSDEGRYGLVAADGGWALMEMTETLLFDLDNALSGKNT